MEDQQAPRRGAIIVTGFTMLLLTIALIVFSEHGYHATVSALKLFFDVVFPSLLPFFIFSDVLLATGMVHYLGVLFEPLMRPLFNVPGIGSFVFSMGLAAGYPMDAVLTAKFRRQSLCTKIEGERLLAFTNSADPLFMFGAVAIGMFGQPALGAVIALAHYVGALLVGFTYRFYGIRAERRDRREEPGLVLHGIFHRATDAMIRARVDDGRPLGRVLNEAISESVGTLFMIMSFIVLFAVMLRVLTATGILIGLEVPLRALFHALRLSPNLVPAAIQGIFEIDLGTAAAAKAHAPITDQVVLVSAIIAWSGLAVHGQVASVLADTDISMKPYFLARFLHAVYASVLTLVFFRPAEALLGGVTLPVFAGRDFVVAEGLTPTMANAFHWTLLLLIGSVTALILGAAVVGAMRTARAVWGRS